MVTGYTMVYNATSAQETTSFGNGTVETVTYDQRLQPTARTVPGVLNLGASFSGLSGRNNGNVFQVTDTYETNGNFTYTYDYLNRLETSSGPGSVLLEMTYDRWGNRSQAATGAGPHKPLSFLTGSYSKNRISSSGYTYDNAGKLTAEPADAWTGRGAMTYQYDAESRMKATGGAATATYADDGHGRRVKKTAGGQTRYYDYDPLGNPVWEYTTLWETFNLYFNGKLVFTNTAAMNPSTVWLHTDPLGTVRVKSNASGQAIAGTRLHYHPFGERVNAKTDPVKYEFTGKERDAETGLDWFGTRYLSSAQGRFTSPDKPFADQMPLDPQSWNLYSSTRNNPLKYVDRTGEAIETAWDVLNIGLGVKSFVDNIRSGSYGSAALDAVGVVVDSAAAVVPFVPGGAGALIKAGRIAENAADVVGALNRGDNVVDAVRATDTAADANKLVPNPFGTKGGPAHQAKVDDVVANVEGRGLTAQNEVRIDTPGGNKQKRYADVVARDANGKIVEIHQVGKQTKGGQPVSRERRGIEDIERAKKQKVDYHPYN